MGSISGGDYVKSSEITRDDFKNQLSAKGYKGEKLEQALSIFDRYAGDDKKLDEQEQIAARTDFDNLDKDSDNEVTKGEYKNSAFNENYKSYKAFYETLNSVTEAGNDKKVIVHNPSDKNEYSTVDGASTSTGSDDKVTKYKLETDPDKTPKADDKSPAPAEFNDIETARHAVYRYLLNSGDELEDNTLKQLFESRKTGNSQENFRLGEATTNDNKKIFFIKYNDKYYQIIKNNQGKTEIIEDSAENYTEADGKFNFTPKSKQEQQKTLREALLESETTDIKHNYLNKHGIAGNSKSVYDGTKIDNRSTRRQHVNPVQTFTSMLLNNNEESSLKFNQPLKGEDIVNTILTGTERTAHKDEISLNDLIKYINSAIAEAKLTKEQGMNTGARSAAGDVDIDMKDITNIGIIFKKYAGDDGYLNAGELDNLIKDLTTQGNNSTKIAKEAYEKEAPTSTQPPENPEDPPVSPQGATAVKANRTRNIAGSDNKKVDYHYENGLRTIVENGKAVTNENIAEYKDHGLFGAGKKDFVRIKGLPENVRAEITNGKLKHNMRVKVKDANGNISYYKVNYNADGTYTLGAQIDKKGTEVAITSKKRTLLISLGFDDNLNLPPGLSAETKNGKTVYKLNNREIKEDVARAHILAYNNNSEAIKIKKNQ